MSTTCERCAYSSPSYHGHRECRRNAPVAEKVESYQDLRLWVPRFPVMRADEWCGEFKEK